MLQHLLKSRAPFDYFSVVVVVFVLESLFDQQQEIVKLVANIFGQHRQSVIEFKYKLTKNFTVD